MWVQVPPPPQSQDDHVIAEKLMENRNNNLPYLKKRLKDNGGKWLGFKTGTHNNVVVRIRRNARKYFYLVVDRYIAENKIIVKDARGKEGGVAIRFDSDSFSLEPHLNTESKA